jgi:hypothetical protein
MKTIAYHFVADKLRDGRAIPPNGEWLEHTGEIEMCTAGLHASLHVADALKYAPGAMLCLVELDGEIGVGDDKVVASKRRIIARFDATELLRADARASALSVIHLWNAPAVVKQYLETGDKSLRIEARNAAYAAARAAPAYAAYAYAYAADAAYAAADAAAYAADAAYDAAYAAADAAAADAAAAARAARAAHAYAYAYAVARAAAAAAAADARAAHRDRLQKAVTTRFAEMGATV